MSEKFDPLDTDETIVNFEKSLGELPTMRPDGKSIGTVDRYELLEKLGQGGFGAVYGARDTETGLLVALKALPSEVSHDAEEMMLIRNNFALVSQLSHPYIAGLKHLHRVSYADQRAQLALGVRENDYLVVMEYAPGATLFSVRLAVSEQILSLEQVLKLGGQIAEALDYAHGKRVLHRDIKPKNIMVSLEGDQEVKVLDFGLAAEIRSSMSRKSKEVQDSKSGTPLYMAPEQWAGRRQGPATDQYALAAMLYELLSGEVPFKSAFDTGNFEIMRNVVCNEPVPMLRELDKKQNASLQRALAKDPAERFESCGEFVAALEGKKVRSSGLSRSSSPRKGKGFIVGLVIAGVLVGGAIFGVRWLYTTSKQRTQQEQLAAETQAQVNGLLLEAQTALSAGNLDGATEKAQAVLKLAKGNAEAQAVLVSVEKKAGERKTRTVKVDAELAFEKLGRDITDLGQGFDQKFEALKKQLLIAKDAYASKSWGQAFTTYKAVQSGCEALRVAEGARQEAKGIRKKTELSRKAAKTQRADELAKKDWKAGVGSALRADGLFEKGKFAEASKDWKKAAQEFQASETLAQAVSAYEVAKKKWENRETNNRQLITNNQLRQFGGSAWTEAEKMARLGAESADEPIQGKQHYETALSKYAEAVKAAEPHLVPQLKITTEPSGAQIKLVAEGLDLGPRSGNAATLKKNKTYTLTVSKKGFKTHTETVRADWNGLKEKRMVLEESKLEPGQDIAIDLGGGQKMEFVWIPVLKGWAGKYEVTNGEYRRFKPSHDSKDYEGHSLNGDRQPVVYVSRNDAQEFIRWMKSHCELPKGFEPTLPSKEEWMSVAQCGDGRTYPWGNSWPPSYGNYADSTVDSTFDGWSTINGYSDGYAVTCPVEKSGKNDWGLYGVGGNVWEWTEEKDGSNYVLRGAPGTTTIGSICAATAGSGSMHRFVSISSVFGCCCAPEDLLSFGL